MQRHASLYDLKLSAIGFFLSSGKFYPRASICTFSEMVLMTHNNKPTKENIHMKDESGFPVVASKLASSFL
jgi:hypothetical protein